MKSASIDVLMPYSVKLRILSFSQLCKWGHMHSEAEREKLMNNEFLIFGTVFIGRKSIPGNSY